MKKLTILTDLDDALWDLCGLWINELNIRYGTSVHPRDVTDWEIARFFPQLTSDQLFAPLHDDEIWRRIIPIAGAQQHIKALIDAGHTVRVVTATHPATVAPKIKRFLELFPMFRWEDVVIASDKSLIHGDILVDDGTHNLEAAANSVKHLFLFHRPHNQFYDAEAHGMKRVKTWSALYRDISEIAEAGE